MSKPIAVLISDVHYNIANLELSDAAMNQAITKANDLGAPLIVCGDLHDSKANLRGECVNRMINTFDRLKYKATVLIGNHDLINEKSSEHSLNFLREYVNFIVDKPGRFGVVLDYGEHYLGYFIPYYSDVEKLREHLKTIPKGSRVFMHQGLTGTNSGEYFQDKSAITHDDVAGLRVISGHYHTRQTIQLPDGGVWDYVGNPFTASFGEAADPEKGYQILMDDGALEFVPTNLREHRVINTTLTGMLGEDLFLGDEQDLVWVKVSGTKEELSKLTKPWIAEMLDITQPFKLDLIPTDSAAPRIVKSKSNDVMLDAIIDGSDYTDERKAGLKQLWRSIIA